VIGNHVKIAPHSLVQGIVEDHTLVR
jgi:hypothetical protein